MKAQEVRIKQDEGLEQEFGHFGDQLPESNFRCLFKEVDDAQWEPGAWGYNLDGNSKNTMLENPLFSLWRR